MSSRHLSHEELFSWWLILNSSTRARSAWSLWGQQLLRFGRPECVTETVTCNVCIRFNSWVTLSPSGPPWWQQVTFPHTIWLFFLLLFLGLEVLWAVSAASSLSLLCVCLSVWDKVRFTSSDRLARQVRLPLFCCFVFLSMEIFSPLKTILRLERLSFGDAMCREVCVQILLWLREGFEGRRWATD